MLANILHTWSKLRVNERYKTIYFLPVTFASRNSTPVAVAKSRKPQWNFSLARWRFYKLTDEIFLKIFWAKRIIWTMCSTCYNALFYKISWSRAVHMRYSRMQKRRWMQLKNSVTVTYVNHCIYSQRAGARNYIGSHPWLHFSRLISEIRKNYPLRR